MAQSIEPDYGVLDRPEVLRVLFHPRPEMGAGDADRPGEAIQIPVAPGVEVGARFHPAGKASPTILFFHGNGEIVADYDELGPLYTRMGINFLPVDYRGYGRSTGSPTVAAMMADAGGVFEYTTRWLKTLGYSGPIIVMGRSLGSASALKLAADQAGAIAGLIVESGFASITPLLELLGVRIQSLGFDPAWDAFNISNIKTYPGPTLVIHAQFDHIIPFSDGQALYDASPAREKKLLMIPGANHNDIFQRGLNAYLEAVVWLAGTAGQ